MNLQPPKGDAASATPGGGARTGEARLDAAQEAVHSRRQFVRNLTRKAAYIAPVVVTLAASRSAFGSAGPSGGPS